MTGIPPRLADNLRFFGLDDARLTYLKEAHVLLRDELDGVLDEFYNFALSTPKVAEFFPHGHINHAKSRQKEHWEMLLSATFTMDYVKSARVIGSVHFKIALPFDFYFGGYSRVSSRMLEILAEKAVASGIESRTAAGMAAAISCAFALDSSITVDAFYAAQQEDQKAALAFLTDGLEQVSKGDLTHLIPDEEDSDFPYTFSRLREEYNAAMTLLGGVLSDISSMTGDLSETSRDLHSATDDLAKRTETQAATLEETSAAVEQLTRSIEVSSQNIARVETEMAAASGEAVNAQTVVKDAIDTMSRIAESSHAISKKVGAINDIAFQTNLLALNAGVEAARAGDHGRGFAVVASEVRALAVRAADSAKEIHEIIAASSKHVAEGLEKVNQTGSALESITENVVQVNDLVSGITSTAEEQSAGLRDINAAMTQLDSVTQQNAAMAEETNAASSEMIASFAQLRQSVNRLKHTKDGDENAGNGHARVA